MQKKTIIKILLSVIGLSGLISAAFITTKNVIAADPYWMSVDPGSIDKPWWNPDVGWGVFVGKDPGCTETDMKVRVYYGDGYYETLYNMHACDGYLFTHTFPAVQYRTYYQDWYDGQIGTPFYYEFTTDVYLY